MEPEDEKTSYFSYVLKTASDLEIVNDENNVLSLKEGIDFGNINDFRAYVCKRLNTIPKSHFCLVTKTIIDMNSDVLKTSITDNALVHKNADELVRALALCALGRSIDSTFRYVRAKDVKALTHPL